MKKKYQQIENFLEYSLQLLHTLEKKQPLERNIPEKKNLSFPKII